jgi:hypothetical protein
LETKARALAGLKGYVTNLATCPDGTPVTAEFVIDAYHRLFQIQKSFRMSKHDLQARPIYHRQRDSIDAHLTIVFAALVISYWIEDRAGWSIKKFVRTARRYRTIEIQAGAHTITAADPLPDDLRPRDRIQPSGRARAATKYSTAAPAPRNVEARPMRNAAQGCWRRPVRHDSRRRRNRDHRPRSRWCGTQAA